MSDDKPLTKMEFVSELIEELIDAAVTYGADPSEQNEIILSIVSDDLYKILEVDYLNKKKK